MAGDSSNYIKKLILNTEQQYQKVSDFQVEMEINLSVPGFRMPKKKFKVFFKQPNKVKINTKGFGVLPKTGLFTSPSDNFDNLKSLSILNYNENPNEITISGKLITDSLKESLTSNLLSKLSLIFSYFSLKKFKSKLDPRKYNGAIFLGLNGPVVKSHGGTDAVGFYHSIDLCYKIMKGNLMHEIRNNLSHLNDKE